MKMAVISFSARGALLAERMYEKMNSRYETVLYTKSRYTKDEKHQNVVEESLQEWCKKRFADSDAIVFIGASGIAVRGVAPFLVSKKTDPAILSADETGKFVISLVSGHLGGANALAEELASYIGAQPVVTTATDCRRLFAVDVFASKQGCAISDMVLAKEVSAALLAGKKIGFVSTFPWQGELPDGLINCEGMQNDLPELGICISCTENETPFRNTLYLIPRVITAGIGCRKGTKESAITGVVERALQNGKIFPQALVGVASIDLKKEEAGLVEYCKRKNLPFTTYSADELKKVPGTFTKSEFVKATTGIDNVCERAAILGSGKHMDGCLIQRKYAENKVTAAFAAKKWSVKFE